MKLKTEILVLLSTLGPMAASEMHKRLGWWNSGAGKIYPALRKLEDEGCVTAEFESGPYPRRRIYTFVKRDKV